MIYRYSDGTRVRIKARKGFPDPFSECWQYESLTGLVVCTTEEQGRLRRSWEVHSDGAFQAHQQYKVRLDIGIEADHVIEECLEAF